MKFENILNKNFNKQYTLDTVQESVFLSVANDAKLSFNDKIPTHFLIQKYQNKFYLYDVLFEYDDFDWAVPSYNFDSIKDFLDTVQVNS